MEKQTKEATSKTTMFSDAYLSGMPAKKRKLIVSANPLANAVATTKSQEDSSTPLSSSTAAAAAEPSRIMLSRVLARTLDKVEMKPAASREELDKASAAQSELVSAFSQEFDAAINERLKTDEDFLSIIKSEPSETAPSEQASGGGGGDDLVVYNKNRFPLIRKNFK